jgi:hypothetical protein
MKTEQEILALNDPRESYIYCLYNTCTANIKAHEQIVLSSKDAGYCIAFAANIPNANIKEHEKIIINSKDPRYCYHFAKLNKSNKHKLFKIVLESKNLEYIKWFYDNINFKKSKYKTLMLFI